jgi:hypothetical protein
LEKIVLLAARRMQVCIMIAAKRDEKEESEE